MLGIDGAVDAYLDEGDGVRRGVDGDDVEVVLRACALPAYLTAVVDMIDVGGWQSVGRSHGDAQLLRMVLHRSDMIGMVMSNKITDELTAIVDERLHVGTHHSTACAALPLEIGPCFTPRCEVIWYG